MKKRSGNLPVNLALLAVIVATIHILLVSWQTQRKTPFMLAAAHPLAAEAGRDILAAGGTAADAAIAVQLVLTLVEPQSSGLGGGAFALYWDESEQHLTSFDGRETAPLAADEEYWLDAEGAPLAWKDASIGGRAVGVPGTLKLLETLHRRHGKTSWADLFAPALRLAEDGFRISARLSASIAGNNRGLDRFAATRAYFFHPHGSPKQSGEILKNPEFATTLRLLAEQGGAPFYHGGIADDIIAATRTAGGILTREDFADYRVLERAPVCIAYRAHEVCGMGPPSSGGLSVGQILGLLEGTDLPALGPSPAAWHRYIEAAKLAYADRALYMADSDFVAMPSGLLDKDYLAERAQGIRDDVAMAKAEAGKPPGREIPRAADEQVEAPGTSHFVIVDRHGDMISMTTTIESGFGSLLMSNGFLLNNEMTDFSFLAEKDGAAVANRVQAGKRPRSSMAPTFVLRDGRPMLLLGSPGGSRIINYVAATLIGILDWGMTPQEAVDMGHVVNRNGATELEAGSDAEALAAGLRALGHEVGLRELNSGLHGILISETGMSGAADKRREGVVLTE